MINPLNPQYNVINLRKITENQSEITNVYKTYPKIAKRIQNTIKTDEIHKNKQ